MTQNNSAQGFSSLATNLQGIQDVAAMVAAAATQSQQNALISALTIYCQGALADLVQLPEDEAAGIDPPMAELLITTGVAVGATVATQVEGACKQASTDVVQLLSNSMLSIASELSTLEPQIVTTQQQSSVYAALLNDESTGNFSGAVTAANQLINDLNFVGLTDNASGTTYQNNGIDETFSTNWQPETLDIQNSDGSSNDTTYNQNSGTSAFSTTNYYSSSNSLIGTVNVNIDGSGTASIGTSGSLSFTSSTLTPDGLSITLTSPSILNVSGSGSLTGSNDTIVLAAGANVTISGTNDSVGATNGTITLGKNTSTSISGTGNTLVLTGDITGSLGLSSGTAIYSDSSGSVDINGTNGNTITLSNNGLLSVAPGVNASLQGNVTNTDDISIGNGSTLWIEGSLSGAPVSNGITTTATGATQGFDYLTQGGPPITWTGTITSSVPATGTESSAGGQGGGYETLQTISGYGPQPWDFADTALESLGGPALLGGLGITAYGSVSPVPLAAPSVPFPTFAESIGYTFSAPMPGNTNFLLWNPGGSKESGTLNGLSVSNTGPFTFTFTASLNGVAVNTSGWTFSVRNDPYGTTSTESVSVNAASGVVTVNNTGGSEAIDPNNFIIVTPNTAFTSITVTANTLPNDAWGLSWFAGYPPASDRVIIGNGSTLEFGFPNYLTTVGSQDIIFTQNGTLKLENDFAVAGVTLGTSAFNATVSDFVAGDKIDITTVAPANFSGSYNVSTNSYVGYYAGNPVPFIIQFDPRDNYSAATFHIASDGAGGTLLTVTGTVTTTGQDIIGTSGNDTLTAATGNNLFDGLGGADTITGGSGADVIVLDGAAGFAGSAINGGGGVNTIQATNGANLSTLASLSNAQILDITGGSATLTASQFAGFTTFIAEDSSETLYASNAGTYNLTTKTITGNFNLDATLTTGAVTLVGNNQADQTLNGGTGTDTITAGTGTSDVVNSSGTNDTVNANGTYAWINADGSGTVVNANAANDTVVGNGANEWINANGTGDTVTVSGTDDTVVANGTNIWVNGNGTSDVVTTSNTGDSINVNGANIWVNANGNNDSVTLSSTNDSINVNGANTWVNLNGTGDSVTLSSTGDSINANSNSDWLNINGAGDAVTLSGTSDSVNVNGSNVWSNINGTDDSITTSSTTDTIDLNGTGCWVNVNGTSDAVVGTGTGNTININSTSDTVSGSGDTINIASGITTVISGGGSDAYEFAATFGQDAINNLANGSATTANGQVGFASGVTDEKLWFQKSGNNLLVDLLGTTDQITIDNWYGTNAGAQVQTFTAGSLKLDTQVASLVNAMATYAAAHTGFNPQTATAMPTDTTLQNAIAASWHS